MVNERQIVHNVHLVMHQTILLEKLCVLLAMLESTLQISLEIPSMKVQCIVRTARVDTTRLMPPVSVLFVEVVTTHSKGRQMHVRTVFQVIYIFH